jgi:hypothetical protein
MSIDRIDELTGENIEFKPNLMDNQKYKAKFSEIATALYHKTTDANDEAEMALLSKKLNSKVNRSSFFNKFLLFMIFSCLIYSTTIAVNMIHINGATILTNKAFDKKLKKEKNLVQTVFVMNDNESLQYKNQPKIISNYLNVMLNSQYLDARDFRMWSYMQLFFLLPIFILIGFFSKKTGSMGATVWWLIFSGLPFIMTKSLMSFPSFIISCVIYGVAIVMYSMFSNFFEKRQSSFLAKMQDEYNKVYAGKDNAFIKKLMDTNRVQLVNETKAWFVNRILESRYDVISSYNVVCELNEQLIKEFEDLHFNYDNRLYRKLYSSELRCKNIINELRKSFNKYYQSIDSFNEKTNELTTFSLVKNNYNDPQNSEFLDVYQQIKQITDFIDYDLEREANYQLLKSQLNVEEIKKQEFEVISSEMQRQSELASYQASLAEKQVKLANDKLKSQLRTEGAMQDNLNKSLKEQQLQNEKIKDLKSEVEKLTKPRN